MQTRRQIVTITEKPDIKPDKFENLRAVESGHIRNQLRLAMLPNCRVFNECLPNAGNQLA
jgi:hypothetical protein